MSYLDERHSLYNNYESYGHAGTGMSYYPLQSESVLLPLSGSFDYHAPGAPQPSAQQAHPSTHRSPSGRMAARFPGYSDIKENLRPTSRGSRSSREFPIQSPSPSKQGPMFAPPRRDLSVKERDFTFNLKRIKMHNAALKIQSAWRGFRVRELNGKVRRARDDAFRDGVRLHLEHLHKQLDLYHQCYQEERQARLMQQDALRILVKQVSELRSWRDAQPNPADTLASLGRLTPQERTVRLESTCGALEAHIQHMNESLENLRTTLAYEAARALEEARSRLARIPRAGCPLPPENLRLLSEGHDFVEIGWSPSHVVDERGELSDTVVLGYKLIVDGAEHSMVFDSKTVALISGLDLSVEHRITVRAAADLGDSYCASPEIRIGGQVTHSHEVEEEEEDSETEQMAAALERTMQLAASHTETPDLPVETPDLPVETPELPVETPELPVETPELPVETPELPVETPELPEEIKDSELVKDDASESSTATTESPSLSVAGDSSTATPMESVCTEESNATTTTERDLTLVTQAEAEGDVEEAAPETSGPCSTASSDVGSTEL